MNSVKNPAVEAMNDAREYMEMIGEPWPSIYPGDVWDEKIRQEPGGLVKWYNSDIVSRAYIRELAEWHYNDKGIQKVYELITQAIGQLCDEFGLKENQIKILDHGAGIGTNAIILANAGYNVDCYEIGNELKRMIKWRTKKWNVADKVKLVDTLSGKYHVIISLDVIEHLEYPLIFPDEIVVILESRGVLIATYNFTDSHPMHLTGEKLEQEFLGKLISVGFDRRTMGWEWPVVYQLRT